MFSVSVSFFQILFCFCKYMNNFSNPKIFLTFFENYFCTPERIRTPTKTSVAFRALHYTTGAVDIKIKAPQSVMNEELYFL